MKGSRSGFAVGALTAAAIAFVVVQSWAGRSVTGDRLLDLLVIALPLAGLYGITAAGLVVVYTSTGVFNFAQGAIGMFMAFVYWDLRVNRGLPTWLSLILVVCIAAPAFGWALDALIMRRLRDAALVTQLMVTVGLMLSLMGIATTVWDPNRSRSMPHMFSGIDGWQIGDITVTWHRTTVLVTAMALVIGLRLLLFKTRLGVAMRAVVDNRDLAGLSGVSPNAISGSSWALGSAMAAIAGILIAPDTSMSVEALTFLILNAFAAAIVGRLRSLPLTYLGALILALTVNFSQLFLEFGGRWGQAREAIPTIMLFVVLLMIPQAKLEFGRLTTARRPPKVPSVRNTAIGMAVLVVAMALISGQLGITDTNRMIAGMSAALIALSLVPLIGWAGQVNLAPLAFAGIGAVTYAKAGGDDGSILAVVIAMIVAVPIGAIIALPALRLQGLYLALSSLAFARMAELVIFTQPELFGRQSSTQIKRLDLFGLSFDDDRSFLIMMTAVFGLAAIALVAVRRSSLGRRLVAMRDSEAASATVGVSILETKVAVFMLSSGVAGLAGAFYAMANESLTPSNFQAIAGLPIVLALVVGGVSAVGGALFAGIFSVALIMIKDAVDLSLLRALEILGPGLAAIGVISNPNGAAEAFKEGIAPLLPWRRDAKAEMDEQKAADALPEIGGLGLEEPFTERDVIDMDRALGVATAFEIVDSVSGREASGNVRVVTRSDP